MGVLDQPAVIPSQDSLIGDLLSMDISGPAVVPIGGVPVIPGASAGLDLLGGGLDSIVSITLFRTNSISS